jgi:general secretion pathway protein D
VDDFAVTLVLASESEQELFTRVFRVPPDFLTALDAAGGAAAERSAAPQAGGGNAPALADRKQIKDLLIAAGIVSADGCSATLSDSGSLMVTNIPAELGKVEPLIQSVAKQNRNR